jgi:beta-glucosidase
MTAKSESAAETADLLRELTLEEKASLCLGSDFWHTAAIERLGIPSVMVTDGPHGLRKQTGASDHVGLAASVAATCFPTASALASSWDVDLVRRVGVALGEEARAENVSVLLGPGINIKRSPLCGRNFEYFAEDPLLSGVLGAAMVDGIQSQGVGTSLKHFAVNNQETDRLRISADVDERALREIYLAAFEHVVTRAQPWTVMCSYNRVNGIYASQHHWLLTEVLRDEWAFEGLVVSDWGAVADRVAALNAGLDLEMPPNLGVSDAQIVAAVRSGELAEADLDRAVARVLGLVQKAAPALATDDTFDQDEHHALARAAAQDSAVLLRNDGEILPLHPAAGSTLGVIGEFARTPRYQGAGSSQVSPTRLDNALDEIRRLTPDEVEVAFAAGFGLETSADDEALRAQAVALAARADTVLLFLGLPASAESEGFDRRHLDLPDSQVVLLAALAEVNQRIVVVLANGAALRVAGWESDAAAVLECWLGGQAAGGAVADLLLGHASPSGRLAETLPRRLEDNSAYLNFPGEEGHVRYGEGVFVGYRGYDRQDLEVSYPFGHGLGYTSFDYADLDVKMVGSVATGDLRVAVGATVTNTGDRPGKEVVQLYVGDVEASVARPVRELKAFTKVELDPGQSTRVRLELDSRAFSYWSVRAHGWVVEAGEFEISVGASSRNLALRKSLGIAAPPVSPELTRESALEEWLADPGGSAALHAAYAASGASGVLGDKGLVAVIGGFPLARLAAFPGIGLDRDALDVLVRTHRSHQPGRTP